MNEEPKLTLRNGLAIIGALATAVGGFLTQHSSVPAAWWTGSILVIVGPVLMGSRAILK